MKSELVVIISEEELIEALAQQQVVAIRTMSDAELNKAIRANQLGLPDYQHLPTADLAMSFRDLKLGETWLFDRQYPVDSVSMLLVQSSGATYERLWQKPK